jgi:hypothetical protein
MTVKSVKPPQPLDRCLSAFHGVAREGPSSLFRIAIAREIVIILSSLSRTKENGKREKELPVDGA